MPSHQRRRDPLPPGYQFGDMRPRVEKRVVVTRAVFNYLVRLHMLANTRYELGADVLDSSYTLSVCDMTFVRGDE